MKPREVTQECEQEVILVFGGVSTRCRIEKKEENGERTQTRRHPMDFPDWKCSKKLQRKKTITTIQIHYSAKLQK